MNPVDEIKKILDNRPKPVSGEIVAINGTAVSVRTYRGLIEARNTDGKALNKGEYVLVEDGIVQGKVRHPSLIPVYPV